MRIGIFTFTSNGIGQARSLCRKMPGHEYFLSAPKQYSMQETEPFQVFVRQSIYTAVEEWFSICDALLFIGAAGIAVRAVAPCLVSKAGDPAILCMDEKGRFVIPLAGGHLGGANQLARKIAFALGSVPVLTTATDVQGKFAVDVWAASTGLHIANLAMVKEISSRVLENQPVGFVSDYPVKGNLPEELSWGTEYPAGICVSGSAQDQPFPITLNLTPKNLVMGIGCRKDIQPERLFLSVNDILKEQGICLHRIRELASIGLKAEETALLKLAEDWNIPFITYTAQELNQLPGEFSVSEFVQSITYVDCVCERSACASGGRLVVPKIIGDGVTVALAELPFTVIFEEEIHEE